MVLWTALLVLTDRATHGTYHRVSLFSKKLTYSHEPVNAQSILWVIISSGHPRSRTDFSYQRLSSCLPYRMHRASSAQVLPIFTDQQLYEHKIK